MRSNYKLLSIILIISGLFVSSGCEKDDDEIVPVDGSFNVKLAFNVDQAPLLFDTLLYRTESGSDYSVNRLQFYISSFEFKKLDGTIVESHEYFYVDARTGENTEFVLTKIPQGVYKSVTFFVGLDIIRNETGALPATIENENMAWPVMMGGGYHFMKFEGNYQDAGNTYGFAMHLGTDKHKVTAGVKKEISVKSGSDVLVLNMNLNEWFRNPETYDFNVDGNYSMSSDPAMKKLAENGKDVFDE